MSCYLLPGRGAFASHLKICWTTTRTLHNVLATYDPSDVGICYDPGHGNMAGDGLDFAEAVKDRLIAFHLNDNDSSADQHGLIFLVRSIWDQLARVIAASAYDKEYMTIELSMPTEPGNIYASDEAEFLAQAMASGLKFHQMVADVQARLMMTEYSISR